LDQFTDDFMSDGRKQGAHQNREPVE
jgi:hypothetical protein